MHRLIPYAQEKRKLVVPVAPAEYIGLHQTAGHSAVRYAIVYMHLFLLT